MLELAFKAEPDALLLRCAWPRSVHLPRSIPGHHWMLNLARTSCLGLPGQQTPAMRQAALLPSHDCCRLAGRPKGDLPLHHALSVRPAPPLDAVKVLAPEVRGWWNAGASFGAYLQRTIAVWYAVREPSSRLPSAASSWLGYTVSPAIQPRWTGQMCGRQRPTASRQKSKPRLLPTVAQTSLTGSGSAQRQTT